MLIDANSRLVRYGTSVLTVGLSLALTLSLRTTVRPLAAPVFLAAVLISTWRGGRGPALTATFLSVLALDYFFIPPLHRLGGGWVEIGRLSLFGLECLLLAWLIDSRNRINNEVTDSREQLRSLSAHLQAMIEEERTRIAREIHDELGQSLMGLKFDVSWLRTEVKSESVAFEKEPLIEKLTTTLQAIDTTILSVRRIAAGLRPAVLDTLGLTAAIEWQADDFERRTGITYQLHSELEDIPLDSERATAVFRIFQESLTNIARHSAATEVNVTLERRNGSVLLQLKDNGKGIGAHQAEGVNSFGILGMQERVRRLNGEISVTGQTGEGTVVRVEIPLHDAA